MIYKCTAVRRTSSDLVLLWLCIVILCCWCLLLLFSARRCRTTAALRSRKTWTFPWSTRIRRTSWRVSTRNSCKGRGIRCAVSCACRCPFVIFCSYYDFLPIPAAVSVPAFVVVGLIPVFVLVILCSCFSSPFLFVCLVLSCDLMTFSPCLFLSWSFSQQLCETPGFRERPYCRQCCLSSLHCYNFCWIPSFAEASSPLMDTS